MVIGRVIIRVTPFRALITLLITHLLRPLPLQVNPQTLNPIDPFKEPHRSPLPLQVGFRGLV